MVQDPILSLALSFQLFLLLGLYLSINFRSFAGFIAMHPSLH